MNHWFVIACLTLVVNAGPSWATQSTTQIERVVYYLFGNVDDFPMNSFNGMRLVKEWNRHGRQVHVIFGASRRDLHNVLKDRRTEFLFWAGHGTESCTTAWRGERITTEDFRQLPPSLRGIMMVSCGGIKFGDRLNRFWRDNGIAAPSLYFPKAMTEPGAPSEMPTVMVSGMFTRPTIEFLLQNARRQPCESAVIP